MSEKLVKCPKCDFEGKEDEFETAVRPITLDGLSVADVGFRCPKCREEFGFEESAR
mgnify:CR=1 FL=1